MTRTAKQIESQIAANDKEIEDSERKLAHLQPDSPQRARLQNRLAMVLRAQNVWRTEYLKLTGVRCGKTTVEHVKARSSPDTGIPNEFLPLDLEYHSDPSYIDNVVAGHYEVATGKFMVEHADGSTVELDYQQILRDLQPSQGERSQGVRLPPGLKLPEGYTLEPGKVVTVGGLAIYRRDPNNNKVYPPYFNATTAPNIIAMVRETEAQRPTAELSLNVGDQLVNRLGLISGQPMRLFPHRSTSRVVLREAFEGETTSAALRVWKASRQGWPEAARSMARSLQRARKRVVVNMGGTGEVADAINVNPNRFGISRKGIPNLIRTEAERMGELFEQSSVHEVTCNRLAPNTIDWKLVLPGAKKVLMQGGRIIIRFQSVGEDEKVIVPLLKNLGFKNIQNWSGAVIEAVK